MTEQKQLSPKRAKALLTAGMIAGELTAQAMVIGTYAFFAAVLEVGLRYGFELRVQWYGLLALMYGGQWFAKFVVRDLSRTYGSAYYEGQASAASRIMAAAAMRQAAHAHQESQGHPDEEDAVRRAKEWLNRGDDDGGAPIGMML